MPDVMTKKPIVMVVDDDSGVRNAMRILLKSVGMESRCMRRRRNSWRPSNLRSRAAWCSTSACLA